jgi:putative membrane-bound dehydrogenase-like protein
MFHRILCKLGASLAFVIVAGQCPAADSTESNAPAPLSDAARRMTVPEGFRVTLFAGEPDVVQPIAMTTDERGRLWVVECLSYPAWQAKGEGKDRVVIFEDRDGDGRFDARRVFWDKGRNLSGIAIGFGGVWLCSAPELIFVPDRNYDDVPDGPIEVMLDGWTLDAKHNIVNGLTWGPDGWLYGCHGILADSKVGRPGSPDAGRKVLNCGVWRFHPARKVFEVVAHGTTNPWGISFDEYGQMFIVNCVIKHLFHVIPGARYERMYGQDNNPYSFRLIESCADHIHWAGGFWKTEGAEHSQNDAAGGGHAHSGAMVYLGDNWPDRYRNSFFGINIHGHRINNDRLDRFGSGYAARHQPDLLRANDPWFRGVALMYGADGGVFVSDWSDAGECHDYEDIHRENGRIYKITFGAPKLAPIDLARQSDDALVKLQSHKNDWFASRARLILQERAMAGTVGAPTGANLIRMVREQSDAPGQLRALWALHVIGGLDENLAIEFLSHRQEHVRGWTIQLALETQQASPVLRRKLAEMAAQDSSAIVRLFLASALQRLPLEERLPIAQGLAAQAEDSGDANLPLMIWYGIEPIVSANEAAAAALLGRARIPMVREFIARRLALRMALDPVVAALETSKDSGLQRDVVRGMFEALNGRREIKGPANWSAVVTKLSRHADSDVQDKTRFLSLIFGDAHASAQLRERVADPARTPVSRQAALQALVQAKVPGLAPLLQSLVSDTTLRGVAIRGLAALDDSTTPNIILQSYSKFSAEEKADAINTLASRASYAVALLEAVRQGRIPASDVSPFAARQILALKDNRIAPLVTAALGEVRPVSKDKAAEIARHKMLLTTQAIKAANPSRGRVLFNRTCGACHTLFDEGGKLAPELTGSQRSNLDYLLENIVDPNAVVWSRYRATYFETADGRLISGVVLQENESTAVIQTQTGTVALPRHEIISRNESTLSMMPEGLFESLKPQEILDLVAYLQSASQVPF